MMMTKKFENYEMLKDELYRLSHQIEIEKKKLIEMEKMGANKKDLANKKNAIADLEKPLVFCKIFRKKFKTEFSLNWGLNKKGQPQAEA